MPRRFFILFSALFIYLNIHASNDQNKYEQDRIYANLNIDSVEAVFRDKTQNPDNRLEAALQLILIKYKNINLDSVISIAHQQFELAEKVNNKYHQVQALRSLGIVNSHLGNHAISLKYFERSLKLAQKISNKYLEAQSLWNIGQHYQNINMLSYAMNYYYESKKIHESLGDEPNSSGISTSMAEVYIKLGNFNKAIELYEGIIVVAKKYKNKKLKSFCYNGLSVAFDSLGDYKKALSFCQKNIKDTRSLKDTLRLSSYYGNLSKIYLSLEMYDSSKVSAIKSAYYARKTKKPLALLRPLLVLGKLFNYEKDYKKSLDTLNLVLDIANKKRSLKYQVKVMYEIYNTYRLLGKNIKADQTYNLYVSLSDSLKISNSSKNILLNETKIKYRSQVRKDSIYYAEQARLKDLKLNLQKDQLYKEKLMRYGLYTLLLLTLGMGLFIYNRFVLIKRQRNVISKQKQQVDIAHKSVKDSIEYTERIQRAVLPSKESVINIFPEHFIMYFPKDVLSGDFYWVHDFGDKKLVALGDCTGHGVPGAYMTVMAINILDQIVDRGISQPVDIMAEVDRILIERLRKNDDGVKDGMDIALCLIDSGSICFTSSHIALYHVNKGNLDVYNGSSVFLGDGDLSYLTSNEIKYSKGDQIYLASDGYADQKGGDDNRKFYTKRFKELIKVNHNLSISEQLNIYERTFIDWKGSQEQVDDVSIIGIKLS